MDMDTALNELLLTQMSDSARPQHCWLQRRSALVTFVWGLCTLAGCISNSTKPFDLRREAAKCAENWKTQGYDFDPNSMTCSQMFERVSAIQRARYWKAKGYSFDPNSMTTEEMNEKVWDINRARYWKDKGYDFDPNLITALEMDKRARNLKDADFWKKLGYYNDPNSQNVWLSKDKQTLLGGSTYATPNLQSPIAYPVAGNLPRMHTQPASGSNDYPNTGSGHWIECNIDFGKFIQLEDQSLWEVQPLDHTTSYLWLRCRNISVIEGPDISYPYMLANTIDGEVVRARLKAR
jgi:hypothetical protein